MVNFKEKKYSSIPTVSEINHQAKLDIQNIKRLELWEEFPQTWCQIIFLKIR